MTSRQNFYNFSMQFLWGSRRGYTYFVVNKAQKANLWVFSLARQLLFLWAFFLPLCVVKRRLLSFGHCVFQYFFYTVGSTVFAGFCCFARRPFDSLSFCAVSSCDVFHLVYTLFSHACVIFVPIVFDSCRWRVHSPRDPRRQKTVGRPSARQVIFVFTCVLDCSSHWQVSSPCCV